MKNRIRWLTLEYERVCWERTSALGTRQFSLHTTRCNPGEFSFSLSISLPLFQSLTLTNSAHRFAPNSPVRVCACVCSIRERVFTSQFVRTLPRRRRCASRLVCVLNWTDAWILIRTISTGVNRRRLFLSLFLLFFFNFYALLFRLLSHTLRHHKMQKEEGIKKAMGAVNWQESEWTSAWENRRRRYGNWPQLGPQTSCFSLARCVHTHADTQTSQRQYCTENSRRMNR